MQRFFFFFFLLLLGTQPIYAQVLPQYFIERHPQGVAVPPIPNMVIGIDSTIYQSLVISDSLNTTAPTGRIKNIYIRTGFDAGPIWKGCVMHKIHFALGHSPLANFDTSTRLISNLTHVAWLDSLAMDTVIGGWVKIPLSLEDSAFYFDPSQNLIVSMYADSGVGYTLCVMLCSWMEPSPQHFYSIGGGKHNTNLPTKVESFMDFGFDLYPTVVEEVRNIFDVTLYPNPAQGQCHIRFSTAKPVSNCRVLVRDITGKVLLQQPYKAGSQFDCNIDVGQLAPGIYLAEIIADDEKVVRKLVVQ